MRQVFRRDPGPLIPHLQDHHVFLRVEPGGQRDTALGGGECLAGVHQEVHHHLLDALRAAAQLRDPFTEAHAEMLGALVDQVGQKAQRRPHRVVQVEMRGLPRLLLPREILQVLDDQLHPPRPLLHLLHQFGERLAHPRIAQPPELEVPVLLVVLLQYRLRVAERLHHHRHVQKDQAVWVVDLVRHPRDQDAQGRHLVRLHQLLLAVSELLLGVAALLDLPGEIRGAGGHLALQGARPEHGAADQKDERQHDDGAVPEDLAPAKTRRLQDAQPFVVDPLVLAGVLQDGEPLVEARQERRVPLLHREAVLLRRNRIPHRLQVGKPQFADQVEPRKLRHHRVVVLPGGE